MVWIVVIFHNGLWHFSFILFLFCFCQFIENITQQVLRMSSSNLLTASQSTTSVLKSLSIRSTYIAVVLFSLVKYQHSAAYYKFPSSTEFKLCKNNGCRFCPVYSVIWGQTSIAYMWINPVWFPRVYPQTRAVSWDANLDQCPQWAEQDLANNLPFWRN